MPSFEEQLAKEQAAGEKDRIENAPPIGMGPNGELNVVTEDTPPWRPTIVHAPETATSETSGKANK